MLKVLDAGMYAFQELLSLIGHLDFICFMHVDNLF